MTNASSSQPNDLSEFAEFADRLADAAAPQTLSRFRQKAEVFNKAGIWYDPVTDADREAERAQRALIKAMYPDHGIIGEEFGSENEEAGLRWVLDPVDGTRAFVCGVPSWTTLIALEVDKAPQLGVIDQPFTQERWRAIGGTLRYSRGGQDFPSGVSDCKSIKKARLTTTDPRRTAYFSGEEANAFKAVAEQARLLRFSLDAYGYGLLALGEFDLVIESGLAHYDFAALCPVVAAAGGVITDWSGNPPGQDSRGRILAAATPELHAEALACIKNNLQ